MPALGLSGDTVFHLVERFVIIVTSGRGGSSRVKAGSNFKLPAGDTHSAASTDPRINVYLGVNTGPYQSDNGTVILPPIPIEWIIAPQNVSDGQCPTRSDNLELFGFTNLIVAALIVIFGCRPLIHLLTGGVLGNPSKFKSAFWTWIFAFGLQVGANAIISRMIVTTPGYEHLSMINVFALYSSRPRLNLLFSAYLRMYVGPVHTGKRRFQNAKLLNFFRRGKKGDDNGDSSARKEANNAYHNRYAVVIEETEWVYTDSYIATAIGEVFVQLISAIFVGVTWHRFPNEIIRDHMKSRVNCLLAAPAMAFLGWFLVPIFVNRKSFPTGEGVIYTSGTLWVGVTIYAIIYSAIVGTMTYGVSWYYWTEFLNLPGSL